MFGACHQLRWVLTGDDIKLVECFSMP